MRALVGCGGRDPLNSVLTVYDDCSSFKKKCGSRVYTVLRRVRMLVNGTRFRIVRVELYIQFGWTRRFKKPPLDWGVYIFTSRFFPLRLN